MTYGVEFPRVDPQLQGDLGGAVPSTKGRDCAIKVIQGGIRHATRGARAPSVAAIRRAIGVPTDGVGTLALVPAYQAFGVKAQLVTTMLEVIDALQAGKFVHCCVNYGWVNANARELSGQHSFTGDHAIGAFGVENHKPLRSNYTAWLDPLHDGRQTGVPQQITMARLRDLTGAMAAFGDPHKTRGVVLTLEPMADDASQRLAAKDASFDAIRAEAERGKAK